MNKKNSRVENIMKNLLYGSGAEIVVTLVSFVSRTIFIKVLGVDYLGVSGLFTSILSVLSLAELGLGNIVIYSLYKPVAENDEKKIAGLVNFYKNVYRSIAAVVMVLGLLLIPFLKYLVNLPENIDNILIYYILFLVDSSASYLYVYKVSVIRADQKERVISLYTTVGLLVTYFFQLSSLFIFKDYLIYLVIKIVCTFGTNFLLSLKATKDYPFIKNKKEKITSDEKKKIFKDTVHMMKYRVGGVFLNSTDNVYISTFVGTRSVGYYNNYFSLIQILNKVINVVYNAIYTSIGNLNATEKVDKSKKVFDLLIFAFVGLATVATTGFYTTSEEIIVLWLGSEFVLEKDVIFAISVNFYLPIVLYPIWMYRNTTGLFSETKNILIYAAIINVILSYFGGKYYGLAGIIIATSISRLLTSFWYEPYVLYKRIFKENNCLEYFFMVFKSILIMILSCVCIKRLTINNTNTAVLLVEKIVLSLIIPTILFVIFNYNKGMKTLIDWIKRKCKEG